MEIGIDGTCWWNRRGFGRFTRELLTAMIAAPGEHRFRLFIDRPPAPEMQQPHVKVVQVQTSQLVTEAAVNDGRRSARDLWRFSRVVSTSPIDLMFFPAVYSWFPVFGRCPTAVTLHDAIAEHFPALVFPSRRDRLFWMLKVQAARRVAGRLITVSEAAKQEIIRYVGAPASKIDVICEGAGACFRPVQDPARRQAARAAAGLPLDRRLLLFVGGVAPQKNLSNLLAGFALAASQAGVEDVDLAIVGDPGGDGFVSTYGAVEHQVENDPRLRNRVRFTGFVADPDLAALYSDALATVLPAVSEGFGLPALESMACGTPVLTSNVGAAPEVAGGTGLTFDPYDAADVGRQIHRAATDRDFWFACRAAAIQRSQHYSWEKAAALTMRSLEAAHVGRR
ncbi:MAG: glycosyltransferase family 4 protein [Pseudomonadota bacterium]|nr:glycosyltransferase family 4 protein [Pseudomonadota bacterium]